MSQLFLLHQSFLGLKRQAGGRPTLLAFVEVADVGVTQSRQFTGGDVGGVSGGAGAVDHNLGVLVWKQACSFLPDLVVGQIERTRQMRLPILLFGQGLDQQEVFSRVHLVLELFSANLRDHADPSVVRSGVSGTGPRLRRRAKVSV